MRGEATLREKIEDSEIFLAWVMSFSRHVAAGGLMQTYERPLELAHGELFYRRQSRNLAEAAR